MGLRHLLVPHQTLPWEEARLFHPAVLRMDERHHPCHRAGPVHVYLDRQADVAVLLWHGRDAVQLVLSARDKHVHCYAECGHDGVDSLVSISCILVKVRTGGMLMGK